MLPVTSNLNQWQEAGWKAVKLTEGKKSQDWFFQKYFDTEKCKEILHKE